MNAFPLSSLITAILSLALSLFVYWRGGKSILNRLWARTSLTISFWSFGLFGVTFFSDYNYAYFSQTILDIAGVFLAVFFVHFVFKLVEKNNKFYRFLLYIFYSVATLLAILSFTKYFKVGLKPVFEFRYWIDPGPIYIIFPIFFLILAVVSITLLIIARASFSGIKSQQIKYVLYTAFIGFGGGVFNFLPQFSHIYPIGNYLVGFYAFAITYAMIKYRLMNIRLIITRSILYAILVGAVAAFFALSVVVVGELIGGNTQTSKIITYIATSFIVVVFLEPVKRTWAKLTDKIFYKDKIDYQEVLREVGNVVAREIDLYKLLKGTSQLLAERLKIKQVSSFVPNVQGKFHLLASSTQKESGIVLSDELVNYIQTNKKILIIDELIRDLGDLDEKSEHYKNLNSFVSNAENNKIEMIVPIVESKNLTAILIFNAKQSGDLYEQDDINFLEVLGPQIATSIEKSKLYEEVERFNKELQQKVEDRTKSLKEVNFALEERNKFLTTIQVVTNMISRTLDLKKVNQMIADSLATEVGYIGGMLSFVDEGHKYLKVGAITNNEQARDAFRILSKEPRDYKSLLEENYNMGVQTFLTGKINFSDQLAKFLSPPVDKTEIEQIQKKLGIKTIVGVPVFSEAKIIGVIEFYLAVTREKISSLDIEIMTALANQVGIVSRNLKLYNTLQHANAELQDANTRLRELDKAKSEFLSIASHQLRTPISAIKGYLSMMIDGDFGKLPDNISDVVKNIFESAARLARLINIFLNVSRIESGRLKLEKRPMQIDELIDSVIVELINQAKQKGVTLEYKKNKKAPPLILADADKLREVVLNLIDNAIKYTPKGSIVVTVKADDKLLNFKVTDTGIGIKKEEVGSLFRKFVRGSGVAQVHTSGSGLGLFIAQKIIKEHDGQVWAESEGSGKGSVFQFTLPVYNGHDVPAYKEDAKETGK